MYQVCDTTTHPSSILPHALPARAFPKMDTRESSNIDPERVSLERRVHELKLELDAKSLMHAKAEEKVMVLEAQREDVACMIKDIRQEKVTVLVVMVVVVWREP